MPMARRFNEKIAIDLKSWKGKYILHMIDMFTRLSVSVFINSKFPPVVVEKIIQHWIGAGWGVMDVIFFIMVENSIILKCVRCLVFSISIYYC